MKKFDELKEQAKLKGHKLLRALESGGLGKTGYIIWTKRGGWSRYSTLADVEKWLKSWRAS